MVLFVALPLLIAVMFSALLAQETKTQPREREGIASAPS